MIKLGATNKDGGKILFLGLSDGNLMLLRRGAADQDHRQ